MLSEYRLGDLPALPSTLMDGLSRWAERWSVPPEVALARIVCLVAGGQGTDWRWVGRSVEDVLDHFLRANA